MYDNALYVEFHLNLLENFWTMILSSASVGISARKSCDVSTGLVKPSINVSSGTTTKATRAYPSKLLHYTTLRHSQHGHPGRQ